MGNSDEMSVRNLKKYTELCELYSGSTIDTINVSVSCFLGHLLSNLSDGMCSDFFKDLVDRVDEVRDRIRSSPNAAEELGLCLLEIDDDEIDG